MEQNPITEVYGCKLSTTGEVIMSYIVVGIVIVLVIVAACFVIKRIKKR